MRIEPFNKSGYFWLPSNEEKKLYGNLSVKNGGDISLEILSTLDEFLDIFIGCGDTPIKIIGDIEDNGLVTLEGCICLDDTEDSELRNLIKNLSKYKFFINRMFQGIVYTDKEEILFDNLKFSVDGLNEWINIRGIQDYDIKSIAFEEQDKIVINIPNDMLFEIHFIFSKQLSFYEAIIKQDAQLKIYSHKPKPLSNFLEVATKIIKFLSFAIDKPLSIKNINTLIGKKNIKVYGSGIFSKDIPTIKQHKMLFQYTDIVDSFEDKITNWLNTYEVIEPTLNLFFSVRYNTNQYLESEFLSLIQAFETYHRQFYKKEEYLRVRLMEILNSFEEYIGSKKELEDFVDKIVNTRNYLTHYDEKKKSKSIECNKLSSSISRMEGIFQLVLLSRIGFSKDEIKSVINGYSELKDKIIFTQKEQP